MIMEGLATIYQLNELDERGDQNLLGVLKSVTDVSENFCMNVCIESCIHHKRPQRLEVYMRSATGAESKVSSICKDTLSTDLSDGCASHISLQELRATGARAARLTTWSVGDIAALKQEMCVLAGLMAVTESDADPNTLKVCYWELRQECLHLQLADPC